MIVFISDIHLTDNTTGKHNIDLEDLDFFWNDIQVEGVKVEDIHLVVLGDFFDVIRSTAWKNNNQPWIDSSSQTVSSIVGNIIAENRPVLNYLKDLITARKVRFTYIMGNHDRLINEAPQARNLIRKSLGINGPNDKFPWEFKDEKLFLYATHGHEADIYNRFPADISPIGDAVVTLLLNPFPENNILHGLPQYGEIKKSLQEIDNLRPATVTPLWIEHCTEPFGEETVRVVKEAWKKTVADFYKDPFVKKWFQKKHSWYNPVDEAGQLKIALEYFTDSSVQGILEKMVALKEVFSQPHEGYINKAQEYMESQGCDYILFGHTHEPYVHLIGDSQKGGRFYINTGTWRKRIVMGEAGKKTTPFAPLETISYTQFYNGEEIEITKKRFEVWDGSKSLGG